MTSKSGTLLDKKLNHALCITSALLGRKESPLTIDALAKKLGISNSYGEQLIKPLRLAGIAISTRGPGGGYHVEEDVTVREVALAVNPKIFNSNMHKNLYSCLEETMGYMKVSELKNHYEQSK